MNKTLLFALLVVAFFATDQYFKSSDNVSGAVSSKTGNWLKTSSSSQQDDAQFSILSANDSQRTAFADAEMDDPLSCSADTLACDFETHSEPKNVGEYVAIDDLIHWQVDAEPMSVGEYISMEELTLSESNEELIVGEFYDVNDYLNESKEPMSVGEALDIEEWISQREFSQD